MLTTGVIVRVFVVDKYSDIAVLKRFSKPPFSISNLLMLILCVRFLLINNVMIVRNVCDVTIL